MEGIPKTPQISRAEQINAALLRIEADETLSHLAAVQEMVNTDFVSPAGEEVDPESYLNAVMAMREKGTSLNVADVLAVAEKNAAEAHWDPRREDAENRPN